MSERGEVNGWRCDNCARTMYAIHVHDGVTPMFLGCRQTVACHGMGVSLMYPPPPVPPPVLGEIKWEWYRPDDAERNRLDPQSSDHVEKGGLLLRDLTDEGRRLIEAHAP